MGSVERPFSLWAFDLAVAGENDAVCGRVASGVQIRRLRVLSRHNGCLLWVIGDLATAHGPCVPGIQVRKEPRVA